MRTLNCEVVVIGGGPAGSIAARQLALSGRDVILLEAASFPRRHVGICLNAGARRMLAGAGLAGTLDDVAHRPSMTSIRRWENDRWEETPRDDLICDRGVLDLALLNAARAAGVRIVQPARAISRVAQSDGWSITANGLDGRILLRSSFLIEAGGRRTAGRRRRLGPPILALFSRWRGTIERVGLSAVERGWVWAAPTADGATEVVTAVSPDDPDLAHLGVVQVHSALARQSGLLASHQQCDGGIAAIDATPFESPAAGEHILRIGEASLGLDPLSSSGLSTAIQSALSGSIVANTLLAPDGDHEAAIDYATASHMRRRDTHMSRTAGTYAMVAERMAGAFWQNRYAGVDPPGQSPPPNIDPLPPTSAILQTGPGTTIASAPCLSGDRVTRRAAVARVGDYDPVAFLGEIEIAPLIQSVTAPISAGRLIQRWSSVVGVDQAMRVLGWAWSNQVLVTRPT